MMMIKRLYYFGDITCATKITHGIGRGGWFCLGNQDYFWYPLGTRTNALMSFVFLLCPRSLFIDILGSILNKASKATQKSIYVRNQEQCSTSRRPFQQGDEKSFAIWESQFIWREDILGFERGQFQGTYELLPMFFKLPVKSKTSFHDIQAEVLACFGPADAPASLAAVHFEQRGLAVVLGTNLELKQTK